MMMQLPIDLLGDELHRDEPLAKYTAARLGGNAEWLWVARESTDQLVSVVSTAWAAGIPVRVIGGGANVLISDQGVRGLVIVNQVKDIQFPSQGSDPLVTVTAGVSLTNLANQCATRGLSGFEWAASVPGTIGGAVVNNAGAHGGDMAGNVVSVDILDTTGQHTLSVQALAYSYRTSALKTRADRQFLVLRAVLHLQHDDPLAIQTRMTDFRARRKATQPGGASLGSIFKNPPGDHAGRLIEAAGLKGFRIGGAMVSDVHANFFINTGTATSTDYAALIDHVQATVHEQFAIELEPEVERIGEGFA